MKMRNVKFDLGEVVITPAAQAALAAAETSLDDLLARHRSGDWGEVTAPVREVNERGLLEHYNLQSTYALADGHRLVVVTNRDRSATMVHLDALKKEAG